MDWRVTSGDTVTSGCEVVSGHVVIPVDWGLVEGSLPVAHPLPGTGEQLEDGSRDPVMS